MKKIIRLNENELINLVKRIIKEDEDQWAADSQEIEGESDFSRMDIQQMPEFQKLVRILKRNPEAAMELQSELGDGLNEEYEYMDYQDAQPKEIEKGEYWKRKLATVGLYSLIGLVSGIAMAGGTSAEDVLQMALGTAVGGGAIANSMISTVHRRKKQ
jgi:hypothetical protein